MGRLSGMGQDEVLYGGLGLGSMMWWWWRLAWREFCRSSLSAHLSPGMPAVWQLVLLGSDQSAWAHHLEL